jgi:hypothetical protein
MNLTLAHLYPDLLNMYSDMGNIICLQKRCQWRGIGLRIIPVFIGKPFDEKDVDLVYGGGGQDRYQSVLCKDLLKKKLQIKKAAENNMPILTTCATYQLFGHYFKSKDGQNMPGISIFDSYTIGSDIRKIGNIVIKSILFGEIVGFENHSGNTFIKGETMPLGKVLTGFGNNGRDGFEGAIYKNVLGSYLHGPILTKNVQLADWLIKTSLERKYKKEIHLKPLDDELEQLAHQKAIKRSYETR